MTVTTFPQQDGISLQTLRTEIENSMISPESSIAGENELTISGTIENGLADIVLSLDDIAVSWRDVQIEKSRLEKTGMKANDLVLQDLAKGHVREMAFVLREAKEQDIEIDEKDLELELKTSYAQAEKNGLPKEAFLSNWGISEEEFKEITKYKLINEKVIYNATRDLTDVNEIDSFVTQYLLGLESKFKPDELKNGKLEKQIVKVVKLGTMFVVIKGGLYADASVSELENIFDAFEFNRAVPANKTFIFSRR